MMFLEEFWIPHYSMPDTEVLERLLIYDHDKIKLIETNCTIGPFIILLILLLVSFALLLISIFSMNLKDSFVRLLEQDYEFNQIIIDESIVVFLVALMLVIGSWIGINRVLNNEGYYEISVDPSATFEDVTKYFVITDVKGNNTYRVHYKPTKEFYDHLKKIEKEENTTY